MSRLPLDVIEIEFGEDARYSPPPGADRWSAFSRTDILSSLNDEAQGIPAYHARRTPASMGDHRRLGHHRRHLHSTTIDGGISPART